MLRTVTHEQAKQEAWDLFRKGEPLFYVDIAQELRIGLAEAVRVCEELIAEGAVLQLSGGGRLRKSKDRLPSIDMSTAEFFRDIREG